MSYETFTVFQVMMEGSLSKILAVGNRNKWAYFADIYGKSHKN
jgi:hypothetical protein